MAKGCACPGPYGKVFAGRKEHGGVAYQEHVSSLVVGSHKPICQMIRRVPLEYCGRRASGLGLGVEVELHPVVVHPELTGEVEIHPLHQTRSKQLPRKLSSHVTTVLKARLTRQIFPAGLGALIPRHLAPVACQC